MGACRETADIWTYLTTRTYGHWWGWQLIKSTRVWRSPYLWHDTFGKRWYRWLVCPWFGHGKIEQVENMACDGRDKWHCFKCEKEVK